MRSGNLCVSEDLDGMHEIPSAMTLDFVSTHSKWFVVEHECGLEACEGSTNCAAGATFFQPCFALSVVTLKEEDWVRVW